MAQQLLVVKAFFIIEASRSHSDTSRSIRLLWTSDQPDAETDIHASGGIRTRNLRKRAGADPCLMPCGHRDRPLLDIISTVFSYYPYCFNARL